ncbi:MAG: ATP-binding protein, partial [archaeon]
MTNSYTSKDIKTLEGIEAIRMRPGMYVGGSDLDAMNHMLLEVISNSIDECLNGHGDTINVTIDTKKNTAEVRDYGRGIPFGKMENGEEALIAVAT